MKSLISLATFVSFAIALNTTPPFGGIPITRRSLPNPQLSPEDTLALLIQRHQQTKQKYGMPLDEGATRRLSKRGGVGLINLGGSDLSYYASVLLGTPPRTFEVVLDTGSADLVIATRESDLCGGYCQITAPFYSVAKSSTARTLGKAFQITYGTAVAEGVLVSDRMSMGGFSTTQIFGACENISGLVTSSDETGLLGLGWHSLASSAAIPFVEALALNGTLESPMFAFGLANLSSAAVKDPTTVTSGGYMTLGGVNSTLFSGSLHWVPVSTTNGPYWSIPIDGVAVGGSSLPRVNTSSAVIDTGTNSIALPDAVAVAIYAKIPGAVAITNSGGLFAYPCNTSVNLVLILDGFEYAIHPKEFQGGVVNQSGTLCAGVVVSLGSHLSTPWIIGTPFLMGFYNAYRFKPAAIGFATLANLNVLGNNTIPTSNDTSTTTQVSSGTSSTGSISSGTVGNVISGSGSSGGSGSAVSRLGSWAGVGVTLTAAVFTVCWVL